MRSFLTAAIFTLALSGSLHAEDVLEHNETTRELSEKAKATLKTLEIKTFESITLDCGDPHQTFSVIRKRLHELGITVRLLKSDRKQSTAPNSTPLVNIPIRTCLDYFNQGAGWGWIVYDDGSITFFDSVCAGNWPKDGVHCHESQYERGHPSKMQGNTGIPRPKDKNGEQGVAPQSATRSESKSEGGDKPQPESEARSR